MRGLHQTQRELAVRTRKALDEVSDMLGNGSTFNVAAGLNLESDVLGNILRPMFKRIEGDDAHWFVELSRHQIGDNRFEVSSLDFGFAVDRSQIAVTVDHEVNSLVCAVGYDPGRPAGTRHEQLQRNDPRSFKHRSGQGRCTKERPRITPKGLRPSGTSASGTSN